MGDQESVSTQEQPDAAELAHRVELARNEEQVRAIVGAAERQDAVFCCVCDKQVWPYTELRPDGTQLIRCPTVGCRASLGSINAEGVRRLNGQQVVLDSTDQRLGTAGPAIGTVLRYPPQPLPQQPLTGAARLAELERDIEAEELSLFRAKRRIQDLKAEARFLRKRLERQRSDA